MGKTIAEQECAHVVKHGKRLLLLGIPPKLMAFIAVFAANFGNDLAPRWLLDAEARGSSICVAGAGLALLEEARAKTFSRCGNWLENRARPYE